MKVIIAGNGKMGHMIQDCIAAKDNMEVCAVIDIDQMDMFDTEDLGGDVIIDFSHPEMTKKVLGYAERTKTPLVCGTTGLTDEIFAEFDRISKTIPLIISYNYSYGVAMVKKILTDIGGYFEDWDTEIIETHHNQKIDAPSGTAKMFIEALDPNDERQKVYGREGFCGARTKGEIGVHAMRGGTVAGEHTIRFFGTDEIVEISHKATSRKIFAEGAITAAVAVAAKEPGRYTVDDLFF